VYLVQLFEDNKKILEPLGQAVDAMKRFLAVGSVIPSWVHPDEAQYDLYMVWLRKVKLDCWIFVSNGKK
jgi:hypothetical protein